MKRFYERAAQRHFEKYRQMLFVAGPRQVGKTTVARHLEKVFDSAYYFNWDNIQHRELISRGPESIAIAARVGEGKPPLIIFDEIHHDAGWKRFLKGFFDTYPDKAHLFVTGSAMLNVYQKGGDSLMGRYFLHRMHPLTVGELLDGDKLPDTIRKEPVKILADTFEALFRFGGFPEPFMKGEEAFYNAWKRLKGDQLFQEDLRDLSSVQRISQVELLAEFIRRFAGQCQSYSSLARKVRASPNAVKGWLDTLSYLYYSFPVRPFSKNVSRSLIKEPKYYLHDWSMIESEGARFENMVACHLLKSAHFWTDIGKGSFELYYLRDKEGREVDFLMTRDDKPYLLVEAKLSNDSTLSKSLVYFQKQLQAEHALQVVMNRPYEARTCFDTQKPIIVSAYTFFSQLA